MSTAWDLWQSEHSAVSSISPPRAMTAQSPKPEDDFFGCADTRHKVHRPSSADRADPDATGSLPTAMDLGHRRTHSEVNTRLHASHSSSVQSLWPPSEAQEYGHVGEEAPGGAGAGECGDVPPGPAFSFHRTRSTETAVSSQHGSTLLVPAQLADAAGSTPAWMQQCTSSVQSNAAPETDSDVQQAERDSQSPSLLPCPEGNSRKLACSFGADVLQPQETIGTHSRANSGASVSDSVVHGTTQSQRLPAGALALLQPEHDGPPATRATASMDLCGGQTIVSISGPPSGVAALLSPDKAQQLEALNSAFNGEAPGSTAMPSGSFPADEDPTNSMGRRSGPRPQSLGTGVRSSPQSSRGSLASGPSSRCNLVQSSGTPAVQVPGQRRSGSATESAWELEEASADVLRDAYAALRAEADDALEQRAELLQLYVTALQDALRVAAGGHAGGHEVEPYKSARCSRQRTAFESVALFDIQTQRNSHSGSPPGSAKHMERADQAEAALERVHHRNAALEKCLEELQAHVQERTQYGLKISRLEAELSGCRNDLEGCRRALGAERAACKSARDEVARWERLCADLKERVAKEGARAEEAEGRAAEADALGERLGEALQAAFEERDAAQAELDKALAAEGSRQRRHSERGSAAQEVGPAPQNALAANGGDRSGPADHGADEATQWEQRAIAEAAARTALQQLLWSSYGVRADATWLAQQGVDAQALARDEVRAGSGTRAVPLLSGDREMQVAPGASVSEAAQNIPQALLKVDLGPGPGSGQCTPTTSIKQSDSVDAPVEVSAVDNGPVANGRPRGILGWLM